MTGYRRSEREYPGGSKTVRSRRLPSSTLSTCGIATRVPRARRVRTRGQRALRRCVMRARGSWARVSQSRKYVTAWHCWSACRTWSWSRRNLHEHGTEEMRAEFRTGEAPVGGASVLRTAPPRYAAMTFSGDRSREREGKQGAFRRRKSALPGVRRVDSRTTSPLTARSRRTQATGVGEKPHRRRAVYLP